MDIFARHQLPALLKTVQSLQDVLQCTVTHAPMAQLEKFMAVRRLAAEDGDDTRGCCTAQTCYPSQNAAQMLDELRIMPLYTEMANVICLQHQTDMFGYLTERLCLLLLTAPASAWLNARSEVQKRLQPLLDMQPAALVAMEVAYLQQQWEQIRGLSIQADLAV